MIRKHFLTKMPFENRYEFGKRTGNSCPSRWGTCLEVKVAYDLMRKGYHLFRPMSLSSPFDLFAFNVETQEGLNIEVKRVSNGKPPPVSDFYGGVDVVAHCTEDSPITYWER